MIRAVRKDLSLQTEARTERVDFSALAFITPIQIVSSVELNARLVGMNLHYPTGTGITQSGSMSQSLFLLAIDHPRVVIPLAKLNLWLVGLDSLAY